MVTIGMNYKVIPGKEEVLEKAFASVLKAMSGIDGHSGSSMYRDISDGTSYLIVSRWSSEDAFQAFIKSDKFRSVTNWGKENVLAGRPVHTVYKE